MSIWRGAVSASSSSSAAAVAHTRTRCSAKISTAQARPKIRLLERPEMTHPADALQGRALSVAPGCIAPEKAWTPGTPGGLLVTQGRFPGV